MSQSQIKAIKTATIKTWATKRKAIQEGYKQAGAIYWTADMEKAIRKIRADMYTWMTAAIVEACVIAGLIYKLAT